MKISKTTILAIFTILLVSSCNKPDIKSERGWSVMETCSTAVEIDSTLNQTTWLVTNNYFNSQNKLVNTNEYYVTTNDLSIVGDIKYDNPKYNKQHARSTVYTRSNKHYNTDTQTVKNN